MLLFPAIDLFDKKAVRLVRGDYSQMTVYGENPEEFAEGFYRDGAKCLHIVDLEGAKSGLTPNIAAVEKIVRKAPLFTEIGGGIRSEDVIERYLSVGIDRVILGTAAVTDERFLEKAVEKYGEKIAVGVDIKDGFVAIKGWTEKTDLDCFSFFEKLEKLGVKTVICTDISKDGLLSGTNLDLYKRLALRFSVDITASGGVSTISDIKELSKLGLYGAILGKALYENKLDLKEACMAVEA